MDKPPTVQNRPLDRSVTFRHGTDATRRGTLRQRRPRGRGTLRNDPAADNMGAMTRARDDSGSTW